MSLDVQAEARKIKGEVILAKDAKKRLYEPYWAESGLGYEEFLNQEIPNYSIYLLSSDIADSIYDVFSGLAQNEEGMRILADGGIMVTSDPSIDWAVDYERGFKYLDLEKAVRDSAIERKDEMAQVIAEIRLDLLKILTLGKVLDTCESFEDKKALVAAVISIPGVKRYMHVSVVDSWVEGCDNFQEGYDLLYYLAKEGFIASKFVFELLYKKATLVTEKLAILILISNKKIDLDYLRPYVEMTTLAPELNLIFCIMFDRLNLPPDAAFINLVEDVMAQKKFSGRLLRVAMEEEFKKLGFDVAEQFKGRKNGGEIQGVDRKWFELYERVRLLSFREINDDQALEYCEYGCDWTGFFEGKFDRKEVPTPEFVEAMKIPLEEAASLKIQLEYLFEEVGDDVEDGWMELYEKISDKIRIINCESVKDFMSVIESLWISEMVPRIEEITEIEMKPEMARHYTVELEKFFTRNGIDIIKIYESILIGNGVDLGIKREWIDLYIFLKDQTVSKKERMGLLIGEITRMINEEEVPTTDFADRFPRFSPSDTKRILARVKGLFKTNRNVALDIDSEGVEEGWKYFLIVLQERTG